MKVSFAILALLGLNNASQTVKNLLEDNTLVGLSTETERHHHHHERHPHEHNLVRSEPRVTNEGRPLDEMRKSFD